MGHKKDAGRLVAESSGEAALTWRTGDQFSDLSDQVLTYAAEAIDRALEIGAMTVDVIRILLQKGRESPAKIFRLDNRPHLQDHSIPEPQICKYSDLIQHSQSNTEENHREKA